MSLLFVVSRSEPGRYRWLSQAFAGEPAVKVVEDRRRGEPRRGGGPVPSRGGGPVPSERRRRDRRARDVSRELDRLGYALIRRHV